MSENNTSITCKPSRWFIWRAVLMSAMFLGFGGYFYYDGAVGYKKKNAQYYEYMAYLQADALFKGDATGAKNDKEATYTADAETWKKFALAQDVKVFASHKLKEEITDLDVNGSFPQGFEFPKKWPTIFAENYEQMKENGGAYKLWEKYTLEKGIEKSADEHFKTVDVIKSQFNWAIGSGVFGVIALFFLFRTMMRKMMVDENNFTATNGKVVAYANITKLDKRKWKRKGLAYLFYKDDEGAEKKARIDGMVYGQFDQSDPNNAENLFQLLEKNLPKDAEIVDYLEEDEEEDAESEADKQETTSDSDAK